MKLSIYSYVGYGFILFALLFWYSVGFDYTILGMLIFGGILLLRDIIIYYKKGKFVLER